MQSYAELTTKVAHKDVIRFFLAFILLLANGKQFLKQWKMTRVISTCWLRTHIRNATHAHTVYEICIEVQVHVHMQRYEVLQMKQG